jgi:hypothetical protein
MKNLFLMKNVYMDEIVIRIIDKIETDEMESDLSRLADLIYENKDFKKKDYVSTIN